MVPPLDHFQGKNKNCSFLVRTISASRQSFFANLTTFEQHSGLKKNFPSHNYNFENGVIVMNHDFEKGILFKSREPLKSGQVCKKGSARRADCSGKRIAIFIIPLKWSNGGTIGWFLSHFLITSSLLIRIIQFYKLQGGQGQGHHHHHHHHHLYSSAGERARPQLWHINQDAILDRHSMVMVPGL